MSASHRDTTVLLGGRRIAVTAKTARALELVRQGLRCATIAQRLGLAPNRVLQIAARAGLQCKPGRDEE